MFKKRVQLPSAPPKVNSKSKRLPERQPFAFRIRLFLGVFHNRLNGGPGIGQWEQLIADAASVAAGFEVGDHLFIVDLARARFVTAGRVRHMDVAERIAVLGDRVADAAFVDLHMVYVIQQLEPRRADQTDNFRAHLGGRKEVADVISRDVERLKVEVDALGLREFGAVEQHVVHRAQLDRVRQVVIVVYYDAAFTERIGVNGHAGSADLFRGSDRLLEIVDVFLLMGRIDERIVRIAVKAGNGDARFFRGGTGRIQIADAPIPEFYGFKTVVLGRLEAVQPVQFGVQRVDARAFSQCHCDQSS